MIDNPYTYHVEALAPRHDQNFNYQHRSPYNRYPNYHRPDSRFNLGDITQWLLLQEFFRRYGYYPPYPYYPPFPYPYR